jgi:hypothetical protein
MPADTTIPGGDASVESPFCGALRSKQYFFVDGLATKEEDYIDPSGHCWCALTQLVVGPDGGKVRPAGCVPGRACYKSSFAAR